MRTVFVKGSNGYFLNCFGLSTTLMASCSNCPDFTFFINDLTTDLFLVTKLFEVSVQEANKFTF